MIELEAQLRRIDRELCSLHAAFAELRTAFTAGEADHRDPDVLTEVAWSALHGLAMLTRTGRLRPALRDQRLPQLLELLRPPGTGVNRG
jgi:hypothetical protein